MRSIIRDDSAVNIEIGYILNFLVLLIFAGAIVGPFYLASDSSSKQAMRAGYTDLGSEIARDITNMYLSSAHLEDDVNINIERSIPLTIGGRGYSVLLKNAEPGGMASVEIEEGGLFGSRVSTVLTSIDSRVTIDSIRPVYSGSGELIIGMVKNSTGAWIWIK